MPKCRSKNRDKAFEIFKEHDGKITNRKIAEILGEKENTISNWKCRDKWNVVLRKNDCSTTIKNKRKQGAQPGNKNAAGHGAPKGNQNATKHGLFSRYLPEDTRELFDSLDSEDPLDLLWDQIKLAYTAIIRAQPIMHVRDQKDKTIEKVEEKKGKIMGERWEVQQAWDKQASFLQAQAKAQRELTSMIRQYEELLHKRWDLATDEQKARIEQMRANTERIQRNYEQEEDEGVEIINDAEKKAGEDIRDSDTKVSANI